MWNPSFKGIKIAEAYIPISTNDPAQKIKKQLMSFTSFYSAAFTEIEKTSF